MYEQALESKKYIEDKIGSLPTVGLILGSGLGVLADKIANPVVISYKDIPHFPVSTVEGHAGQLVIGELQGKVVIAMQGRFHFYEGYTMQQVTFPVRVMKLLGVEKMIITNAAGGINETFTPGTLMLLTNQINFTGTSPLIGKNDERFGPRFPDMTTVFDKKMLEIARQSATKLSIDSVREGVYLGLTGPAYETGSEIHMMRGMGADAVGMSTVPEVIVAAHMSIPVLGISCITNLAAGILDQPLNHAEVIEVSNRVQAEFLAYMEDIIASI